MDVEARWQAGFNEGWHSFVEGYNYPEPDDTDEAFTDGLYSGWEEAERTAPIMPKFVEEETSRFFNDLKSDH
jgi:hypothetical protein